MTTDITLFNEDGNDFLETNVTNYMTRHDTYNGDRFLQLVLRFDDNTGVSVIQNPYSYGGRSGLCEAARIRFTGPSIEEYEVFGEPEGWLNEAAVMDYIMKAKGL